MEVFWTAIAGFIASALGALTAGFVGVRFGLQQYRREKGLDRRLAWYSEICETAQVLTNRTAAFSFHVEQGDEPMVNKLLGDLQQLSYRFQELALFADFYAAPDTAKIVREMLTTLNALAPGIARSRDGDDQAAEQRDAAVHESISVIRDTSQYLVRDIRREFGLEPLIVPS